MELEPEISGSEKIDEFGVFFFFFFFLGFGKFII